MAIIKVSLRFCNKTNAVKKHGMESTGRQRYKCYNCNHTFQINYKYKAWQTVIKDTVYGNEWLCS